MYSRYASNVGIPSVCTVYGAPVTVDFCTGDVIMGKSLPEVVYSSVLLIFVCCCTQTQLNHTFIIVGWMGEREGRGGERRGGDQKSGSNVGSSQFIPLLILSSSL